MNIASRGMPQAKNSGILQKSNGSMEESTHPKILVVSVLMSVLLLFLVVGAFVSAKKRTGTIVLPGGRTYLGPTPSPDQKNITEPVPEKIAIPASTPWVEKTGTVFPYTFSYPESLSLGVFPNDPFDAITIFYPGTDANANIFFRVENLTSLNKKDFIGKIQQYANTWWKDYAWKSVSSVTPFTNKHGLKGYRALYVNNIGKTPYEHVFFEVPDDNNLVIWMSGKLFDESVFNTIVDSVSWQE